jgi:4-hydroxy-2-oxoheptanedioate aldolase
MRANRLKQLLKSGKPAVGTWLSLGSISAARFMARSGLDWLCVDVEHSLVNVETTTHMVGSIADANSVPLVRVPSNRHDHIKRVLDNGGYGVVVPMVNTRQEAEDAVAACLYPPKGTRSVGGSVHALNFDANPADYYAKANDEIAIILQCEHIQAVRNFENVYSVPGVDAVFVGPNDLAASMRSPDGAPPAPEAFQQALKDILAGCKKTGNRSRNSHFQPGRSETAHRRRLAAHRSSQRTQVHARWRQDHRRRLEPPNRRHRPGEVLKMG